MYNRRWSCIYKRTYARTKNKIYITLYQNVVWNDVNLRFFLLLLNKWNALSTNVRENGLCLHF